MMIIIIVDIIMLLRLVKLSHVSCFFLFSVLKQDLSTTILPFVGCMGGYVVRLCSYLE